MFDRKTVVSVFFTMITILTTFFLAVLGSFAYSLCAFPLQTLAMAAFLTSFVGAVFFPSALGFLALDVVTIGLGCCRFSLGGSATA